MTPAKRLYTTRRSPTTESAIATLWFSQLYLSLGDIDNDGSVVLRAWWKPLVTLIWLGALVMVAGGLVSLSDRRLRVGAPQPAAIAPKGAHAWFLRIAMLLAALFFSLPLAYAVQPDEMLKDPALESRARHLSAQLRCMVCQNQSIDDSDAELARDLRLLVRERISAGDSDGQVLDYLVSRYGEFVLLKPAFPAQRDPLGGAIDGATGRGNRAFGARAPPSRRADTTAFARREIAHCRILPTGLKATRRLRPEFS